ncbi:MAG TPA: LuxR C-terminal-related transcriptional regulator [Nocardioides sp.]|uniref:LuxR C-terminal-related transcriptional regulator n=1 Tax=Nocardioides sp. TaxID=35761 RepID=UPI002F400D3D
MTSTPLVETKFYAPPPREGAVLRPRLYEHLSGAGRLTLVSAPAGFGKTTLVGSWVASLAAATGARVAWVALDAGDVEPEVFWTYVLAALERAAPGTGSAGLAGLGAGQPVEAALTAVLNELSVMPDDVVVVLDDYHLADGPAVRPGLVFLLERLPPQVRLMISTRADPTLPLARLRARGQLVEVRASDLRFTDAEVSEFLTAATGRSFNPDDVQALTHRTEGWVASLQLAALSLRGRDDPSTFISGFTGDDRYVVDYLVEEVLGQEPDEVRDFLLETAVLDRLNGALCDAVTDAVPEGTSGATMLESLERRNLFVVPLDDQRRWYRYHHLFADVLRARLLSERPADIAELHRRASEWYAGAGQPEDAVRHAITAGDMNRAADLVEQALPELRRLRRESVLRGWATQLPDEVIRDRPVLAVGLVGGLMASNDFADVDRRLGEVEEMLTRPAAELVVLDPSELERLPGAVETFRAGLELVAGDLAGAIRHARNATAKAPETDHLTRAAAAGLSGLANWAMGDIAAAHAAYTECADGLTRAGHIADVLGCSLTLADMELALGRLRDAENTLERALGLAGEYEPVQTTQSTQPAAAGPASLAGVEARPVLRGSADIMVGLSRAAWHRNDLSQAAEYLRRADAVGEAAGLPQHPYRWRVALARLRAAEGDYGTAVELLDEAERVYVGDFSPQVHPIHATRARVLLACGDVDAAAEWARRHGLAADDDLSYLREYEHLTLARVLLAEHAASGTPAPLEASLGLLERLREAAAAGGRFGTVIEVETLLARAHAAAGAERAAIAALERAIDLAQPDGWVRYFVDAGPAVVPALDAVAGSRPGSRFVERVLTALETDDDGARGLDLPADPTDGRSVRAGRAVAAVAGEGLIDPLSDRELDVLRLLASDLDGPAIARQLVVSLNTVRTHTRHIYTKLDVNNRRSAVSRGHQLGLLNRFAS